MSSSSFLSSNSSENSESDDTTFNISDYLAFDDDLQLGSAPAPPLQWLQSSSSSTTKTNNAATTHSCDENQTVRRKLPRAPVSRVAFRTKSEHEMLDDGYKWKKYGKKMVKATPHPRNYYKCAKEGCNVKKRVERQNDDCRYVITTYEGNHNHQIPSPAIALNTPGLLVNTKVSPHEKNSECFKTCSLEESFVGTVGENIIVDSCGRGSNMIM